MKTIDIQGTLFSYEDEVLTYNDVEKITLEDCISILQIVKKLFSEKEIRFALAFGTLLGAIREKSLINGDEDVDVFIDDEVTLYKNLPFFYENDLKLIRMKKGKLYSFRSENGAFIDVYILRPLKWYNIWSFYCVSLSNHYMPKKYFREYQNIDFLGDTYLCPKAPEKLLEFWYGKTWRTPVRGHSFKYEVSSAYYWHKYYKKVKYAIQKYIGWYKWRHYVKKVSD